jgi:putative FmdB family regulatory protein
MPSYDVRCRTCGTTFEITRPMSRADDPAPCPNGHDDTVRLLPAIAVTGVAARAVQSPDPSCDGPACGSCCGGGTCQS